MKKVPLAILVVSFLMTVELAAGTEQKTAQDAARDARAQRRADLRVAVAAPVIDPEVQLPAVQPEETDLGPVDTEDMMMQLDPLIVECMSRDFLDEHSMLALSATSKEFFRVLSSLRDPLVEPKRIYDRLTADRELCYDAIGTVRQIFQQCMVSSFNQVCLASGCHTNKYASARCPAAKAFVKNAMQQLLQEPVAGEHGIKCAMYRNMALRMAFLNMYSQNLDEINLKELYQPQNCHSIITLDFAQLPIDLPERDVQIQGLIDVVCTLRDYNQDGVGGWHRMERVVGNLTLLNVGESLRHCTVYADCLASVRVDGDSRLEQFTLFAPRLYSCDVADGCAIIRLRK